MRLFEQFFQDQRFPVCGIIDRSFNFKVAEFCGVFRQFDRELINRISLDSHRLLAFPFRNQTHTPFHLLYLSMEFFASWRLLVYLDTVFETLDLQRRVVQMEIRLQKIFDARSNIDRITIRTYLNVRR